MVETKSAMNVTPKTKIMRLGPVGLIGTLADFSTVKAGVRSCSFASACCSAFYSKNRT